MKILQWLFRAFILFCALVIVGFSSWILYFVWWVIEGMRLKFLFAPLSEVFMSELAIYRDERSAVIASVAVGSVGKPKVAGWQNLYTAGFIDSLTKQANNLDRLDYLDRVGQAAFTTAKLKRETVQMCIYALTVRYSECREQRANAANKLAQFIKSKAPIDLVRVIIWVWACKKTKRGVIEQIANLSEKSESTFYRYKREIVEQLDYLENRAVSDVSVELAGTCLSKQC